MFRSLVRVSRQGLHKNTSSVAHGIHDNPGLIAKRIISCVGDRLRQVDPQRWDSVPITFQTHFRDEAGYTDIHTSIHVHDALEKEFGIEVNDKKILVTDIETAFFVVAKGHDSI